ncbi:MAG TPA: fatty acyl-AMP ligase, partial [Polyangiaceae bacterium]|nr:fatty acyl-AMP ligase [Polyangiaceae bacterium]
MSDFKNFVQVLLARAEESPELRAFTYLHDGERDERAVTFGELDRRARAIGAYLQASCAPGARVVLLYPPGLDYVAAFFGCLYGGLVAVPAYPPDPSRLARTLPRLQAIVGDAGAEVVLTTGDILALTEGLSAFAPELGRLRWVATDALDGGLAGDWRPADAGPDALAFLQYTSGSTGTPKGVMLTHGNLLANEASIERVFGLGRDSVGVGWLPLYHDMGLIGNVLQTVYVGFHCVLMSPLDFLQRPMRWLEAIARFGGTTSGAPNFAYDLCARKAGPGGAAALGGLDLSTWSVAFCGAEPVRRETLERFARAFAPAGFRREAFLPCYGLAEATLIVSGKAAGADYRVERLDAKALEEGRAEPAAPAGGGREPGGEEGRAEPAAPAGGTRELVSCGGPVEGTLALVVDPATRRPCAEGRVGEIWVAGPHVAVGYWGDAEKSAQTFGAELAEGSAAAPAGTRFLRTGDLGFVRGGEIYVSGRSKDLIIVRGRNYYPQDVERAAEEGSPRVRRGGVAAFAIGGGGGDGGEGGDGGDGGDGGEERVVVAAELSRPRPGEEADAAAVFEAIRRAVSEDCALHLHAVV